jgi:hypothetical protein
MPIEAVDFLPAGLQFDDPDESVVLPLRRPPAPMPYSQPIQRPAIQNYSSPPIPRYTPPSGRVSYGPSPVQQQPGLDAPLDEGAWRQDQRYKQTAQSMADRGRHIQAGQYLDQKLGQLGPNDPERSVYNYLKALHTYSGDMSNLIAQNRPRQRPMLPMEEPMEDQLRKGYTPSNQEANWTGEGGMNRPITGTNAPAPGTRVGGYVFMGGNPRDKNNWQQR